MTIEVRKRLPQGGDIGAALQLGMAGEKRGEERVKDDIKVEGRFNFYYQGGFFLHWDLADSRTWTLACV
jgi:hypothetical protein